MQSLSSLPGELIFEILSQLPLGTVESVALTFNHPITEISVSVLQPLFNRRNAAKRLVKRFGPVWQPKEGDLSIMAVLKMLQGHKGLGLSTRDVLRWPPNDRASDLECLGLNGDLEWLQPLAPWLNGHRSLGWGGPAAPAASEPRYGDLVASAERVGVTLPPPFLKFLQDPVLHKWVHISCRPWVSGAPQFRLGHGGLRRVPRSLDGGAGGYLIRILWDPHLAFFINLYLEPLGETGGHCLLVSDHDYVGVDVPDVDGASGVLGDDDEEKEVGTTLIITDDEKREAEELGVRIARFPSNPGFRLVCLDFEEWLARIYYDAWLALLVYSVYDAKRPERTPIPEGLKTYVRAFVGSTV